MSDLEDDVLKTTKHLRDRLAAILKAADETWDEVSDPHQHQADVLIAELGLQLQVAGPDGIAYGKHRYVTEWENDD